MERIIRGGRVLLPNADTLALADIYIRDGLIVSIGPDLEVPAGIDVIDATDRIVIPGLVNAHTHAHNNLSRGLADRWTLEDLLNHGPALMAGRTSRDHYVSAAIGAIEMLKSGCTAVYDLFMALPAPTPDGTEAVVQAYGESGIRAVLAPAVSDMVFYKTVPGLRDILPDELRSAVDSISPAPTDGLLQMMERHIREWHGSYGGRIEAAVAPTIPGQCSDEMLERCVKLAHEHDVGIHTHLAETKMQVLYGKQRWGRTPLQQLHAIGAVSSRFTGAHGVWLSEDDIRLLAENASSITHNPASNLRLGSGIAPVREMVDAGVNVSLGADGSSCSDNQNIFSAMHFAGTIGNVRFPHKPGAWLGAEDVWHMATCNGCSTMGTSASFGVLRPGARADIVLLDGNGMHLKPLHNILNALVYAETGNAVETVLVDGEIVVENREVLTLNEASLRAEAAEAAERIANRNPELWQLAALLTPYIHAACQQAVSSPMPFTRYAPSNGQSFIQ